MVLADNMTHWNSTYLSIHRALKLCHQIMTFYTINAVELVKDTLSTEEWNEIRKIELILMPFQKVTKHLEGNAVDSHYGSIWEVLPAVKLLLNHLEQKRDIYTDGSYLSTNVNLIWAKLYEYYELIDITSIYTTTLFLHSKFRFKYFRKRWTTKTLQPFQKSILAAICKLYNEQYRSNITETVLQALDSVQEEEEDIFTAFLNAGTTPKDEFDAYLNSSPIALEDNVSLFKW
jgi:hypothetical protein